MKPVDILLQHDMRLVATAIVVCLTGAIAATTLLYHAARAHGATKGGWLFLAAVTTGAAIWAAQFIMFLAFAPNLGLSFDAGLTSASFLVAIVGCGLAAWAATIERTSIAATFGGILLGATIAVMNYIGMAATEAAGTAAGAHGFVAAAMVVGVAFSASAFAATRRLPSSQGRPLGALFITAAVCGLHFTSLMATNLDAAPLLAGSGLMASRHVLGYIVGGIALLLAASAYATSTITRESEADTAFRLKHLADAAIEGLVLTEDGRILDANRSFLKIVHLENAEELRGLRFWNLVRQARRLPDGRFEGEILCGRASVPIEIIARESVTRSGVRGIFAVRDLSERREAERNIRFLAFHDSLTGLANRAAFNERMSGDLAAAANSGKVALLLIDLDRFKEINDMFGHATGDAVLRDVAATIRPLLSETDFFARIGGDEFAIIQSGRTQPERATLLAERIVRLFPCHPQQTGREPRVGMSIGVSIFPDDGETPEKLMANADLALYRAKERGRGCACFFEPQMDEGVRRRRLTAAELKQAIEANQLEVYYQPQMRIATGEIVGYEALARWHHPERGFVSPEEFVSVAEDSELIYHLGDWVLRQSCADAASWVKPCTVAVNLSAAQFNQPDLVESIQEILVRTGLSPRRLELEVTETALIEDRVRALGLLRRMKALGISVSLDDFGTGYSSLSTLHAFPFDKLKIDRQFITTIRPGQPNNFLRAIIGIGESLNIPVHAEGVEERRQLDFLAGEGCELAQGYLIGEPRPQAEWPHLRDPALPMPGLAKASDAA